MHRTIFGSASGLRACVIALVLTVSLSLNVGATSFTISGASTTAQTLSNVPSSPGNPDGPNPTGTVTATGTLTVSGSAVAVTITGNNATLTNLGSIKQTGTGRVIRDNTGVSSLLINNGSVTNATALMQAQDADVIQMNVSNGSVLLNNYGKLISLNSPTPGGNQAVDFSAITTGTNTVNNFATGLMQATEADAVRPGVNGVVNNSGTMLSTTTTGSSSDGVDAQNNTGVIITNAGVATGAGTGLIEGGRHGITGGALNNTVTFTTTVTNNVGGVIKGDNGSGINLDGFNALQSATIVNNGLISGNGITGDGDGVDVDGLVNITNTGTIRSINAFSGVVGSPALSEGITVGGGTIVNSGTIEGLVAPGNTNAVGRGISLLGNDVTSGPLIGTREAIYGNAIVTNQAGGLIRGQSDSGIVVEGPASGFTVVINNNAGATVLGGGTTNAAIRTGADNDTINNAGTIDGSSSGKAISMGAGNNTLKVTGGQILGSIDGGVGGTNVMTVDVGAGNAFTTAGVITDFTTLEIKSGSLKLGKSNQIDDVTNLLLNGGIFDLNNFSEGAAGLSGLGNLSLSASSTIDFGDLAGGPNAVQFGGVGSHTFGTVLNITDFAFGLDHLYFSLGPTGTIATLDTNPFAGLFGTTDVCFNGACGYRILNLDGYYEVVSDPVPEPATLALLGVGLLWLGFRRIRRPLVSSHTAALSATPSRLDA